jgi:hypothetical protein
MKLISLLLLLISLQFFLTDAKADPREGEFADLRLADKFDPKKSASRKTDKATGAIVFRTQLSADLRSFQRVEVFATPKTLTIFEIWAVHEFNSAKDAQAFYDSYETLTKKLYLWACPPIVYKPGKLVQYMCDPPENFLLVLKKKKLAGSRTRYTVSMGLTLQERGAKWDGMQKRISSETGKK